MKNVDHAEALHKGLNDIGRAAAASGFSIDGIRTLLSLWNHKRRSSAAVKTIAQRHINELEGKIRELQSMAATLRHLVNCSAGDQRPDCPILVDLEGTLRSP